MAEITVASTSLELAFSRNSGSLIRMVSNLTGWEIHRREALGACWKLQIPIPGEVNNFWLASEKQAPPVVSSCSGGFTFLWHSLKAEDGRSFDISVLVTVRVVNDRILWDTEIRNGSAYTVESVCSPCVGDLTTPAESEFFECFYHSYNAARSNRIWPTFDDNCGYWGTSCATNYIRGVPESPYVLLHNGVQGLFCGVANDSTDVVSWRTELHPGFSSCMDYSVPKEDYINDHPVHFAFSAVHCPYIAPGDNRRLTPVFFQSYQGDWQNGVDVYKNWIAQSNLELTPNIPEWVKQPHSWLQYQINSPVDDLRMIFRDLPHLAKQCKESGINVIQLTGWNIGGQDRNLPDHSPDPRLGTTEELKEAIAECHKLGVRIILFVKFTWADQSTQWFRTIGKQYAAKNPYGDYYWIDGYQYQTPTQQLSISSYPLIPMCFSNKDYRQYVVQQMKAVSELGCDGILYDECQHHGPALLCFDPSHGHRPGVSVYQMDRILVEEIRKECGLSRDFLIAGEACYDWESSQYAMSYHRSQDPNYLPVARYTRPFWPMATAVCGFADRNMINQCLLYRFIISYEPFNFKGFPSDCGETLRYGRIAEIFRHNHRAYIWDAKFQGTKGVSLCVHSGDKSSPYSVFRTKGGSIAVLVANYSTAVPLELSLVCVGTTPTHWRTVEDVCWHPLVSSAVIPPQSAVLFASPGL